MGTWSLTVGEPAVVLTPATSNVSFTVHGTPWNGPHQSPRARASSAARALASAASLASVTIALRRGLWRAIRSRIRVVSSTEETSPRRIARATSSAEAKSRSATAAREARAGRSVAPTVARPPPRKVSRVEVHALTREKLPRESSLLGGHHADADRSAAKAAQPLDHAPVEAMALEPASLVPRDPLVTHAVELCPGGLARGSEVGEPRVE